MGQTCIKLILIGVLLCFIFAGAGCAKKEEPMPIAEDTEMIEEEYIQEPEEAFVPEEDIEEAQQALQEALPQMPDDLEQGMEPIPDYEPEDMIPEEIPELPEIPEETIEEEGLLETDVPAEAPETPEEVTMPKEEVEQATDELEDAMYEKEQLEKEEDITEGLF